MHLRDYMKIKCLTITSGIVDTGEGMHRKWTSLALTIGLVGLGMVCPKVVRAVTYYISTTGSDQNEGTSTDAPWATIQKAADIADDGDTVQIMAGTYNQKFAPKNSGTSAAPITYMAYPGAAVTIDGTGISLSNTSPPEGLITINGFSYIKIQGLTVANSTVDGVSIRPSSNGVRPSYIEITNMKVNNTLQEGIYSRSGDYITISNNSINYVNYSSGISFWWCDHVFADHNTIVNAHVQAEGGGGHEETLSVASTTNFEISNNDISMTLAGYLGNEGIDVKQNSRYGKVHHNYVHDYQPQGGGIYLDAYDAVSPGLDTVDVYNNYLRNTADGITAGSEQGGTGQNINIYNNRVYHVGSVGIGIPHRVNEGVRGNINIYNNTIYQAINNGGAGIYITSTSLFGKIRIRNNVVYFNNWNGGITAGSAAVLPYIEADHNLVYGPKECSQEYPGCIEISNNPTGWPLIFGNTTADPKFVNLTTPDLHLQSTSPAINTGVDLRPLVAWDADGKARPIGTAFDIGAYEFGTQPIPTVMPVPGDQDADQDVDYLDMLKFIRDQLQTISIFNFNTLVKNFGIH